MSASTDGLVKIWDYNTTGYYLQLQEWNINQELGAGISCEYLEIDVSLCSRYVAVLSDRRVFLKNVQNNGKTMKSMLLPEYEDSCQIMFSTIDGDHSFLIRSCDNNNRNTIKIWCPYGIDDEGGDPDTLASWTTVFGPFAKSNYFALSHDKSMLAIYTEEQNDHKVMLYSIENNNNSTTINKLTLKHSFSAFRSPIRFTPDDNYISYNNKNGLAFWNITTGREITDKINITYNKNKKFFVIDFDSSGQRVLVEDPFDDQGYYIASFWESKVYKDM